MRQTRIPTLGILALTLAVALVGGGCETKGPAERAGEKAGAAVDNSIDALNPKGPAERAGEKIDNAVNR